MYREGAAQEEEEEVQPVGATVQLHWFHLSGECTRAPTGKAQEDIPQKMYQLPQDVTSRCF